MSTLNFDDLTSAEQLKALAKARADLSGEPSTMWWTGDVYTSSSSGPHKHLFGFEGLNVSRLVEVEGGYELLSREAAFFLDPRDRQILKTWDNPFTEETVDVLHIWNDPVNQRWLVDGPRGPFRVPMTRLGDRVCFSMDIPLAYPSPLPVAEYPDNSAYDTYRALELFQFFTSIEALNDDSTTSAACELSWERLSPWMPWMRMGSREGGLIYQTRGYKLASSADLPAVTRDFIGAHHPEYLEPPTQWSEPNETSWTYFKKQAAK